MKHAGRRPLLVVAHGPPNQAGGTSTILRRLLENFSAEDFVLLARSPDPRYGIEGISLPYPVVNVPGPPVGGRGERYWRLAAVVPGIALGLRAIARFRPAAVLAMYPDEASLILGYCLSRMTGLPLLPYFCDLWMEDRPSGWPARLARWVQPRVFRAAHRLLVVTQGMQEFYKERYGIDSLCLPNCINRPIPRHMEPAPAGTPCVIGYSGNVNATRLGSLLALVKAVGGRSDFAVRYFTPQSPAELRAMGVWSQNVTATFVRDETSLLRQLERCDILLLPLTFDPPGTKRDQLAICFGTKTFEYFLSRRPILLHASSDYFMSRFFRQWECGLVVDDASSEALGAGLEMLRVDAVLRDRCVRGALRAAREFEGAPIASRLRVLMDEIRLDPGRDGMGLI